MKLLPFVNLPIFLSISFLLSIGILVIFSSSKELAIQQTVFALVGMTIYLIVSNIDYRSTYKLVVPMYILSTILLVVVLILGFETRGSLRWIPLGFFNIQPSEFAKPALVLALALFWSRRETYWINIIKSGLILILPGALIYEQPDLGTFLTVTAIWVGLVFAARISFKKILAMFVIAAIIMPVAWFTLHDYQKQRITSFLTPQNDPLGTGYNIIQSTIAVGSGQIYGRGLGHGTQSRLQFLPEYKTDFIFASIAEELGFVGSILIIAIYIYLFTYCLRSTQGSPDAFGYLIIVGAVFMTFFQTVINIGMNIGMFPITGITLPLISYGGSSLISTLLTLGLVTSVINQRKKLFAFTSSRDILG